MLIPFPIAFLVGAVAADVAGALTGNVDFATVGYYLLAAGLVMGVLAGAVGAIDYVFTVPPNSSAKRRATRHLAVNLTSLLLFGLAWFLRGSPGIRPEAVLIVFEVVAAAMLTMGAWLGGTLTFRNQIGVDHRYAGAGKWSERRVPPDATDSITVARIGELEVGQMRLVRHGRQRIVLARNDDGWVAFSDRCTHRGGSLAGGVMACGIVTCPWHGSQFSVTTGAVHAGPATEPIRVYPIRVEGTDVRLDPRVVGQVR